MNTHRLNLAPMKDATGTIRQFVSCPCGKHRRTKHRGLTCDCCQRPVKHQPWGAEDLFSEWCGSAIRRYKAWLLFITWYIRP